MENNVFVNNVAGRRGALLALLLACLLGNTGCYYYKSVGHDHIAAKERKFCRNLRNALNPDKYVIIHQGNSMQHLENMVLDLPRRKHCSPGMVVMSGSLEDVDSLCAYYYNKYQAKNRRARRYFIDDENYVISQVHVYLKDDLPRVDSVAIPVSAIDRIEEYRQASGRTSWTWAAVNIVIDIAFFSHSSSRSSHSNAQYGPRSVGSSHTRPKVQQVPHR